MRIAYVCYWNAFRDDGVTAKINTQTRHWLAAGHDVEVFALSPEPRVGFEQRLRGRAFRFRGLRRRFGASLELARAVRDYCPDVLYVRYDLFLPPVRRLLRRFPALVEINEDDRGEYRLRSKRARLTSLYNLANRRAILGAARGFVCVTHELAERIAAGDKPTLVIGNGIELDDLPTLAAPANDRPRLVFSGTPGLPWHGTDKLPALAQALPELDFVLVGASRPELARTWPANVDVHPFLSRKDYEPLFAGVDAALGTLALHRKSMEEASPLKVREYLAYGLPVVIGYEDTDFAGEDPWFLLRLPNTEANTAEGVEAIREFVERVRGRRVPREDVADRIGAAAKERSRLDFLARIA